MDGFCPEQSSGRGRAIAEDSLLDPAYLLSSFSRLFQLLPAGSGTLRPSENSSAVRHQKLHPISCLSTNPSGLSKSSKAFLSSGRCSSLLPSLYLSRNRTCLSSAAWLPTSPGGFPSSSFLSSTSLIPTLEQEAAAQADSCPKPQPALPSLQGTAWLVLGCSPVFQFTFLLVLRLLCLPATSSSLSSYL